MNVYICIYICRERERDLYILCAYREVPPSDLHSKGL